MVGLWECNVSRTLRGYLVLMNSLINPWKWVVGIFELMRFSWIKCIWKRLLVLGVHKRKKRVCYTLHFHEHYKGWLKCLFFFQCSSVCHCLWCPILLHRWRLILIDLCRSRSAGGMGPNFWLLTLQHSLLDLVSHKISSIELHRLYRMVHRQCWLLEKTQN